MYRSSGVSVKVQLHGESSEFMTPKDACSLALPGPSRNACIKLRLASLVCAFEMSRAWIRFLLWHAVKPRSLASSGNVLSPHAVLCKGENDISLTVNFQSKRDRGYHAVCAAVTYAVTVALLPASLGNKMNQPSILSINKRKNPETRA